MHHGSPRSLSQSEAAGSSSSDSAQSKDAGAMQIANLRRRLLPLISVESQLADRLNGGISVSGSGKAVSMCAVYVRSGWQSPKAYLVGSPLLITFQRQVISSI
jgi:hypothetical protein